VPLRCDVAFALAPWALVGCGAELGRTQGPAPSPHPDVATNGPVRLVGDDEADLLLYVSNQSFDDAEVRLTVEVDGVTVVDGDFQVEDQHTWIRFPLSLSSGSHEITAESDSGATLRESFAVPGDKKRYAVIDHWTEEDGSTDLSWVFSREALAFA
jgi:hypothetical protein